MGMIYVTCVEICSVRIQSHRKGLSKFKPILLERLNNVHYNNVKIKQRSICVRETLEFMRMIYHCDTCSSLSPHYFTSLMNVLDVK